MWSVQTSFERYSTFIIANAFPFRSLFLLEVIKHYREYPEWVTYEGVLEVGEVANLHQLGRAENRPDKGQFLHLDASSLAEGAGARNHDEAALALVTALSYRKWERYL